MVKILLLLGQLCMLTVVSGFLDEVDPISLQNELTTLKAQVTTMTGQMTALQQTITSMQSQLSMSLLQSFLTNFEFPLGTSSIQINSVRSHLVLNCCASNLRTYKQHGYALHYVAS